MSYKTGTVSLVGKPNVGKSTLVNAFVGQKVSIVSNKPQTTRKKVLGIKTTPEYQMIFIDTPGVHTPHTRLGKSMVGQARGALEEIDVILVVVDGSHHPGEPDEEIAAMVKRARGEVPVVLCMNKMDQLKAENVEHFVAAYTKLFNTEEYMMTTATQGRNVEKLLAMLIAHMPEGEAIYPEDEFTDQSSKFIAGELVREKILNATRDEIPHATAVMVDDWEEEGGLLTIRATILVEKASQRGIILGKQGQFIKNIGTNARKEIEQLLERHIFLQLHVKVQEDWRMNSRVLHELEYEE